MVLPVIAAVAATAAGSYLSSRGHNTGRWQHGLDMQALRRMRRQDQRLLKGLRGDLESWYNNEFLRELISPAHASRIVGQQYEQIAAGQQASKTAIQQRAAAQNLGKAFTARQEFLSDVAAQGARAQAAGDQAIRRQVAGAQREEQYAQGRSDIKQLRHSLSRSRTAFKHGADSAYNQWQGQRSNAQRAGIARTIGVAAGGFGAMGEGGMTPMQGALAGGMAANSLMQPHTVDPTGSMAASAFTPIAFSGFSGMAQQTPTQAGATGFNPLLSVGLANMMGMGISPYYQSNINAVTNQGG
ncbi:MAG: hypothetical protein MJA83_09930 [Gammaproteobacteria bacterium]|nr:hypothetical protein [Gammaproteobacteria bacterium]